ncbi:MAG: hypothetical protein Q4C95_00610 [Planctomycetia bacterium]|nr:hypothetical protein [Planctomycetia bacterium]
MTNNKTDDFRASSSLRSNATARADRCFKEGFIIKTKKILDLRSYNILKSIERIKSQIIKTTPKGSPKERSLFALIIFSLILLINQGSILALEAGYASSKKKVAPTPQYFPNDQSDVINIAQPSLKFSLVNEMVLPKNDNEIKNRTIVSREQNRTKNNELSNLLQEMEEDNSVNATASQVEEPIPDKASKPISKRNRKSLRNQPIAQLLTIEENEPIDEITSENLSASSQTAEIAMEADLIDSQEISVPMEQSQQLDLNEKEQNEDKLFMNNETIEALSADESLNTQTFNEDSSNKLKWNRRENMLERQSISDSSKVISSNSETSSTQKPILLKQNSTSSKTVSDSMPSKMKSQTSNRSEQTFSESSQLIVQQQSPVIDIQTIGLQKLIVGQESSYELKVCNKSSVDAQQLIISTEIPNWVNVNQLHPSVGSSNILPAESPENPTLCQWKMGTLAAGKEESLILKIIPLKRNNFELVSRYEYEQTTLKAGIEVQEPIIELLIEGQDSIEWGIEDNYRLRVRNIGNGDAENLQLLVSTGENEQATQILPILKAGEEKVMDMSIKTVLENEITIRVAANGKYGLSANIQKTIAILRGKLDIFVEAPELQFVNNSVDYLVHISNSGTAPLKNVEVAANIPSEVKLISCSGDGQENAEKNRIIWSIPVINPNENIVYQVSCEMIRSGLTRLEVSASEPFGLTAASEALVQVDAIAALNMQINSPNAPAAVGSSVIYEVIISNKGTKAAEEINSGLFLTSGLLPLAIAGNNGFVYPEESKVLFKQINSLPAGESMTFQVQAEVVGSGNQKVQAILDSKPNNIQLACEEILYCYEKRNIANRNINSQSKVALRPTNSQQRPMNNRPASDSTKEIPNPNKLMTPPSGNNLNNLQDLSFDLTQKANDSLSNSLNELRNPLSENPKMQQGQTEPSNNQLINQPNIQSNILEIPFSNFPDSESGSSVRF